MKFIYLVTPIGFTNDKISFHFISMYRFICDYNYPLKTKICIMKIKLEAVLSNFLFCFNFYLLYVQLDT